MNRDTQQYISAKEKRAQLMTKGFCVFENVLDLEMIASLNAMSEWTITQEDPVHFEEHRSQGCIIPYYKFPHPTFRCQQFLNPLLHAEVFLLDQ